MNNNKKQIIIIGAGFAGLKKAAWQRLAETKRLWIWPNPNGVFKAFLRGSFG